MLRLVALDPSMYSVCKAVNAALRGDNCDMALDIKCAMALDVCHGHVGEVMARACTHGHEDVVRRLLPGMERPGPGRDREYASPWVYDEDYELSQEDVRYGLTSAVYCAINGGHHRILRMLLDFARPWTSTSEESDFPSMLHIIYGGGPREFTLSRLQHYCETYGKAAMVKKVIEEEWEATIELPKYAQVAGFWI